MIRAAVTTSRVFVANLQISVDHETSKCVKLAGSIVGDMPDTWIVALEADHIQLEHSYYVNPILGVFTGDVTGATESNFFDGVSFEGDGAVELYACSIQKTEHFKNCRGTGSIIVGARRVTS